jgi:hypothetical protein
MGMRAIATLLPAIAVCLPAMAGAEDRCPWLNAATAGGVLGGAVQMTVTPASCEFVRQYSGHETVLRIEVGAVNAPHAQCGSGTVALKAIGNEAMACTHQGKQGWMAEQVVGRVRDQAFLVRVGTDDPSAAAKMLREKARNVAEQVAGILF